MRAGAAFTAPAKAALQDIYALDAEHAEAVDKAFWEDTVAACHLYSG